MAKYKVAVIHMLLWAYVCASDLHVKFPRIVSFIPINLYYLRKRSGLAVNCFIITHCLEVSCKERAAQVFYLHTTDRLTVNYYSTIHALELIYFDSNTQ